MGKLEEAGWVGHRCERSIRPSVLDALAQTARLLLGTIPLLLACSNALPEAGQARISCLSIGDTSIVPLPGYFAEDPLFTYVPLPQVGQTKEERLRLDRLYFPRTRKELLRKFDMVFIHDPRIDHWEVRYFADLDYAFREKGMASFWSFGPSYSFIASTIFYDILPIHDYHGYYHRAWHIVFEDGREPVFLPFREYNIEKVIGDGYGNMAARLGSTTWAKMQPINLPWMVSWRPGGERAGMAWVLADEFCMHWWGVHLATRGQNPFAIDMMANIILYSLDRPLITDVQSRREARHLLSRLRAEKSLVFSMIEWADGFGANTMPLSERVTQLDADMARAKEHYLYQDYDGTISILRSTSSAMAIITSDAVRLKNEALFWVFLSEWLVVTATFCLSGFSVWSLMIRRRLYKPAPTTRVSPI